MLKKLIAHQIIKTQHANAAELILRGEVLPIDSELSGALLAELRDSFQKRNPFAGVFESTGGTHPPFQQLLLRYKRDGESEAGFVAFTTDAMRVLKVVMEAESLATGGYVVFAEYDFNNVTFLLAALLSTLAKPSFDENLNLVPSVALDLEHLRHSARIRLENVETNSDGVVSFISQRRDGIPEYFVDFIGAEEIARPEVQGRRLYSALDQWATGAGLGDEEKRQLMGQVYAQWADRRRDGRTMTLTGIANLLRPENPEPLLQFLAREDHQLAGEFSPPSPSVMKHFVRFSFQAQGLRLEFDRNQWQNRVDVDRETRILTIREVPWDLIAAIEDRD